MGCGALGPHALGAHSSSVPPEILGNEERGQSNVGKADVTASLASKSCIDEVQRYNRSFQFVRCDGVGFVRCDDSIPAVASEAKHEVVPPAVVCSAGESVSSHAASSRRRSRSKSLSTEPAVSAPAADPRQSESVYQWQLKNGCYVDYEEEEQKILLTAWSMGQNVVRYMAYGFTYEINFVMMVQLNISTGQMRQMRVIPREVARTYAVMEEDLRNSAAVGMVGNASLVSEGWERPRVSELGSKSTAPPNPSGASQSRGKKYGLAPPRSNDSYQPRATFASAPGRPNHAAHTNCPGAPLDGKRTHGNDTNHGPAPPAASTEGTIVVPPEGVRLPDNSEARIAAVALLTEMVEFSEYPHDKRRALFKALCLQWHPDKNPAREDMATEMFQFLQALKSWFLI